MICGYILKHLPVKSYPVFFILLHERSPLPAFKNIQAVILFLKVGDLDIGIHTTERLSKFHIKIV